MEYNRLFDITVGESITQRVWKPRALSWADIVTKLRNPRYSDKTYREYSASEDMRNAVKASAGGYVAGAHSGAGRGVISRSIVTIDMDELDITLTELRDLLNREFKFRWVLHSTASSTVRAPKARLLVPLSDDVSDREQYEALVRIFAAVIGMKRVDWRSVEWNRVMFWPVALMDSKYFIAESECTKLVDPAYILDDWYFPTDWRNFDTRPVWEHEAKRVKESAATARVQDPTQKGQLIGAFCRTYTIAEAIETFIPDVYEHVDGNRWKYTPASSMAGAVVYDETILWSNHASDPAAGYARNAFDLVRIHKFLAPGTPDEGTAKARSMAQMTALAEADAAVQRTIVNEQIDSVKTDFAELIRPRPGEAVAGFGDDLNPFKSLVNAPDNDDWRSGLTVTKGVIDKSIQNMILIIENELQLPVFMETSGGATLMVALDDKWQHTDKPRRWEDTDKNNLYVELSRVMGGVNVQYANIALAHVANKRGINTLQTLLKDNAKRYPADNEVLEEVLIRCVGAEDTPRNRLISKKFVIGMVARAIDPGCKMDNTLLLIGAEGVGKSTFCARLGNWRGVNKFSDSLTFDSLMRGKEAYEALTNTWVIEIAEFEAAARRVGEGDVKRFLSKTVDDYRPSHAEHKRQHRRSCVFICTTNDETPLSTSEGNRRWWGVRCGRCNIGLMTDEYLDRVYAAAYNAIEQGETWWTDDAAEIDNREFTEANFESEDPYDCVIRALLDKPVPANWRNKDTGEQYGYMGFDEGTELRTRIRAMDVWVLGLGKSAADLVLRPEEVRRINRRIKKVTGWEQKAYRINNRTVKGFEIPRTKLIDYLI